MLLAKKGQRLHHPSYAWISIMSAYSIVEKGCRWQVGNGDSIGLCFDKWSPTPSRFSLTSPPIGLPIVAKVNLIINPSSNTWQADVIRQAFSSHDANTILGIPFSSKCPIDRLIWAYTSKGHFTVSSAYKVALSSISNPSLEGSNGQNCRKFWKFLWGLNVPNKFKNFAWWACHNILSTKANLCHQKILDDLTYEACGLGIESNGNLFWFCPKVQEVQTLLSLPLDMQGFHFPKFIDLQWYLKFVLNVGNGVLELVITIA